MKCSATRVRFGVGFIGGRWRVITQTNNYPAVIYDPGYDTQEEAWANANLASDTYRQALDDNGVTWVRTR